MRYLLVFLTIYWHGYLLFAQQAGNLVVSVFADPECSNCKQAVAFLQNKGVAFDRYEIDNPQVEAAMWELLEGIGAGRMVVMPVVLINDVIVYPVYESGKIQAVSPGVFMPLLIDFLQLGKRFPFNYSGQQIAALYADAGLTIAPNTKGNLLVCCALCKSDSEAKRALLQAKTWQMGEPEIVALGESYRIVLAREWDMVLAANWLDSLERIGQHGWIDLWNADAPPAESWQEGHALYVLISNSFLNKELALRRIQDLKQAGFSDARLWQHNQYHRVEVARFSTWTEAVSFAGLHADALPECWIMQLD